MSSKIQQVLAKGLANLNNPNLEPSNRTIFHIVLLAMMWWCIGAVVSDMSANHWSWVAEPLYIAGAIFFAKKAHSPFHEKISGNVMGAMCVIALVNACSGNRLEAFDFRSYVGTGEGNSVEGEDDQGTPKTYSHHYPDSVHTYKCGELAKHEWPKIKKTGGYSEFNYRQRYLTWEVAVIEGFDPCYACLESEARITSALWFRPFHYDFSPGDIVHKVWWAMCFPLALVLEALHSFTGLYLLPILIGCLIIRLRGRWLKDL